MADQGFREIQLGSKQLVALFMGLVVMAVAIFLLGISVGRGLPGAGQVQAGGTEVAVANAPVPAGEMPPATETTPADRKYHDQLQGQTPPPPQAVEQTKPAEATPAAAPPPAVSEPVPNANSAARSGATTTAKPESPATAKPAPTARSTEKPTPAAPAVAAGGWFVQVDAFRSRENADRSMARLKSRGYSPVTVSSGGTAGLFLVRVGPFAQRDDADRIAARLREEGAKPSVRR